MIFYQFIVFCVLLLVSSSLAWLAPERCAQNSRYRRSTEQATTLAPRVNNIQNIADQQNARLRQTYIDHKFFSIPIRGESNPYNPNNLFPGYNSYAPSNCTFYTRNPSLIASVDCDEGISCTLTRLVSTVDTYTASEGYNWGVKVSSKFTLIEKVFEIGGEVSTGGTYSCAYTKGKTVSDTVSCTDASGKGRVLQLYNVRSDMKCLFGKTMFESEIRDGRRVGNAPIDYFTLEEKREIIDSAAINLVSATKGYKLVLDADKLSDEIFRKLKRAVPKYNAYTDIVIVRPYDFANGADVYYHKVAGFQEEYEKVIPFTDEDGNSIYQYACITN